MAAKTFNHSLTAEQIRAALDYNPYTGLFRWRYRHDAAQRMERETHRATCRQRFG